ncbi:MAG: PD40 domain-containing protein [Actinobacteria bacterium]|nr:PD40 domain-containing protein [Actinomycetota bacterium]
MNVDGSGVKRLTRDGSSGSAVFSPNGKRIAFASSGDGDFDIYAGNADGSAITKLTNNTAVDGVPDWSRDGQDRLCEQCGWHPGGVGDERGRLRRAIDHERSLRTEL